MKKLGNNRNFNQGNITGSAILSIKYKQLKNKIHRDEERLAFLRKKKDKAEKELDELTRRPVDVSKMDTEIAGIEEEYKERDSADLVKYNDRYRRLQEQKRLAPIIEEKILSSRKEIGNLAAKILLLAFEIENNKSELGNIEKRIKELQRINLDSETSSTFIKSLQNPVTVRADTTETGHTYDVRWSEVVFGDHFLQVKIGGITQKPIGFPDSRKSLNKIKAIYTFRRVPHLQVELKAHSTPRIVNPEVLNYVVQFLTFGNSFDKKLLEHRIFKLSKYRKFDKTFYKNHIPQIFQPSCFAYLNEKAVEDLPIIPVPETVINSSGATEIHESFMFPIIQRKCIIWLWESLEDRKASYVFKTSTENLESDLQLIFDYLVGDTTNKRYTLITNSKVAAQLGLRKRILHKSEEEWKAEVRGLFTYQLFPHLL